MNAVTVTDVRLFDGRGVHDHVDVYVDDTRVGRVETAGRRRPAGEVVDGRGRTLLPGLVDAHVHLVPGSLGVTASYGVTTVLDMFSKPDVLGPALGDAGVRGRADVRSSSVGATAPGGHPSMAYAPFPTLRSAAEADAFVEARVTEGATHLKVICESGFGLPTLDAATIAALCDAAHERGLVVAAHVSTADGAVLVADCGADVLAHAPFDAMSPAQVAHVASRMTAVVGTLSVLDGWPGRAGRLPLSDDPVLSTLLTPAWAALLADQADRWLPPTPSADPPAANVLALHRAGVRVLAGTDSPNPGLVPGLSLHRELARLVAAGLSPIEALGAATSAPAEVFGLTDRGVVEPGRRADLLLVDGDPTADIADSGRIVTAWVAGVRVPEPSSYAGGAAETEGMAWLAATTRRILDALADQAPVPRDVVREDDGELLGRLLPTPAGWLPVTTFGAPLADPCPEDAAEAVVRARGLASLAEPWLLTTDDVTTEVLLLELEPDRVRARPLRPEPDDDPAGTWHDLAAVGLRPVGG